MTTLLEPYTLHDLKLPNRMVMAPMTRTRADDRRVPTNLMRDYYVQRASAGLIVTECAAVRADNAGIIHAPGIYNAEQVAGWREVVDAVHAAGGHAGRDPSGGLGPALGDRGCIRDGQDRTWTRSQ